MLRNLKALQGLKLGARDGVIGRVKDFYFEDQSWTVRYLVADTGTWLPERKVLISPFGVKRIDFPHEKLIEVDLTKKQIEESPSIDADKPVSRQFETQYHQHYDWPLYWEGPWVWGLVYTPDLHTYDPEVPAFSTAEASKIADYHLRSASEVSGYAIQARDGHFGHVEDFILDEETWQIRYLVVDTRNWWPRKEILLAPQWISRVSWPWSRVYVEMDQETIKQAPEYDEAAQITREYEEKLYRHYQREPYWARPTAAAGAH